MDINTLTQNIVNDLGVELADEFDKNFERKGFFTEKWPEGKLRNNRGSLMMRSGNLRRSIKYNVRDNMITFSSSLPYASIHNEGGEIIVTEQMRRYFWAMYYKAAGNITTKKNGDASNSKRNTNLKAEAAQWKNLALMKVGQKIKVEKRQFVGDHPQVATIVQNVLDKNMEELNEYFIKELKP